MISTRLSPHNVRGERPPGNGAGPFALRTSSASSYSDLSDPGSVSEAFAVGGFDGGRTSWRWSWSRSVSTSQPRPFKERLNPGYTGHFREWATVSQWMMYLVRGQEQKDDSVCLVACGSLKSGKKISEGKKKTKVTHKVELRKSMVLGGSRTAIRQLRFPLVWSGCKSCWD